MNGKYIVDTNVIIRLLAANERSVELFDQADYIYIPVIVVGELRYGAENSSRKQTNLDIFNDFISQYEVLDVDLSVAREYGEIKAQLKSIGMTIPENDIWIAAIAKANACSLLTFDSHFTKVDGLKVIN